MPEPRSTVFLDTSELIAKGRVLASSLRVMQGLTVVTSELVLRELAACYRGHLRRAEQMLKKNFGNYFPTETLPDPARFEPQFRQFLKSAGVQILPGLPTLSLDAIITADLTGEKPFGGEGAGYRDYLNWLTFVDHVQTTSAPAGVFLTSDKDFFEGEQVAASLLRVARDRGCLTELRAMSIDKFRSELPPRPPASELKGLEAALRGWISIVEDSELLQAMGLPGPGFGIELKVLRIRDEEVEPLRGPQDGTVQLLFRATFELLAIVDAGLQQPPTPRPAIEQPWRTHHATVRLEWTVEAPYDDAQGITGMPRQVAAWRLLDPATGQPAVPLPPRPD